MVSMCQESTTDNYLSHRNARVAAQGRQQVSNPKIQAQNVLMRKWRITSTEKPPDANVVHAYEAIYHSPLGSIQRKAIETLFMAVWPQ
jgi:hypothetical protein